jgi:GNAT superfamily N-acetyltransferase
MMNAVAVTRARESEAPACLALLPRFASGQSELLIARADGAFAGAAGVNWVNALNPAGFSVDVKVLSPWRRKGVGGALIEAAADLAEGETDGLWAVDGAPFESPAAKFLEACGFSPLRREYHYEVANETLLADTIAIAERMRRRGRVPERAEIRWLSEPGAPLEEIAWLVSKEFGSHLMANIQGLRRRSVDAADHSLYVRLDGEVVAVMLLHTEGDAAIVDVRAVAKRWRNNWPNLLMLERALSAAKAAGFAKARFYCDEGIHDTMNLARRGDGEETDAKARYYRSFDDTDFGSPGG